MAKTGLTSAVRLTSGLNMQLAQQASHPDLRLTHKAEAARFQLFVEIIQQDIRQQWRKRTALHRAFGRWLQFGVDHDARCAGSAR